MTINEPDYRATLLDTASGTVARLTEVGTWRALTFPEERALRHARSVLAA